MPASGVGQVIGCWQCRSAHANAGYAYRQHFDNRCVDLQSLRAKAEAGDKAAALELAEDDDLFKQHMQPEELQRENRAKIRRVDPTVNLAADGFDRWSEGATARDTSKVCHGTQTARHS